MVALFTTCKKDDIEFESKGVITGPDFRKCICCGGWFIGIGGETYRFYELPSESDLDLENSAFPIEVKLNWHKKANACMSDEIIIEVVERI